MLVEFEFHVTFLKNFKTVWNKIKVFKYVNCRNLIKNTEKWTKKGKYDLKIQKNDQNNSKRQKCKNIQNKSFINRCYIIQIMYLQSYVSQSQKSTSLEIHSPNYYIIRKY